MNNYQLWDRYMRAYDFLMNVKAYQQSLADILNIAEPKGKDRILDAGSGTGNLSIMLKAHGAQVVSLDFALSALSIHRAKDPGAELLHASLEETLPLSDASLETICCASVLFTLSQRGRRTAINEFYRILKPGGRLILTMGTRQAGLFKLLQMHYAGLRTIRSRSLAAVRLMLDIPQLAAIAYYNFKLQRLPHNQGFSILNESDLRTLLSKPGFTDISVKSTYGASFLLVVATKGRQPFGHCF